MDDGATTIGRRLRSLRMERGYTQQGLAERAELSLELVSKLERGERQGTSWASMVKLARALDVDPGLLAGKRPQLNPVPGAAVLTVRDAVLSPDLLPGLPADHDGEPAEIDALWHRVERDYGAYFAGEFGALSADLPSLLAECRLSAELLDPVATAAPLAHAYQLAACVLVHTGRDDAAAVAAERAIQAARAGNDQYRLATLYGTYSWVLLHQGRNEESEKLALRAAEDIEPAFSRAPVTQVTAWGGLILSAAVAAGAREDADQAHEYLSIASAAAARAGDRHDYWVSFGPTHVSIQTTHIMTTLHRPDLALDAGQRVQQNGLFKVQYGRHRLNVARALLDRQRTDEAVDVAAQAKELSPEWFRHQGFARTLVDDLVERKSRLSTPLRGLVQAFRS